MPQPASPVEQARARIALMSAATSRRLAIASAVYRPCLKALLLPFGAIQELYDYDIPAIGIRSEGDKVMRMSAIQELYDYDIPAIGIRSEGDKVMRMSAQIAKIEAGAVHLPRQAAWLDALKSELLAFPQGLHDDQVDSISQALNWISQPRRRLLFGSV